MVEKELIFLFKKEEDELAGCELSCSNGCSLYFKAKQDWAYGTQKGLGQSHSFPSPVPKDGFFQEL